MFGVFVFKFFKNATVLGFSAKQMQANQVRQLLPIKMLSAAKPVNESKIKLLVVCFFRWTVVIDPVGL